MLLKFGLNHASKQTIKQLERDFKIMTINNITFYFIPSSEFNAYLKQIKVILSAVKRYRFFSLVTKTIYIFSL